MSHVPLRKEKDCLNCGTIVQGRYCHVCGQENVVPKETFWHMVTHFFYDITHFDSSFFRTVWLLIVRPGFLSKEYMLGRRARYLHPIRMYVFTSAFFFLLFFSFFKIKNNISNDVDEPLTMKVRKEQSERLQKRLQKDTGNIELKKILAKMEDSTQKVSMRDIIEADEEFSSVSFNGKKYVNRKQYDSLQHLLPANERDGWLGRRMAYIGINLNQKYRENPDEFFNKFFESILHRLPYMLFFSLPLFALILRLVYLRRRQFIYADHGVFTIHLYIFSFILLLVVFGVDKLEEVTGWGILNTFISFLFLGLFFYLYKAMKIFYGQKWAKTFLKFILVALSSVFMMAVLFALFTLFSAATL